jgi:hypothetical protein
MRKIIGPKKRKATGGWRNFIMGSFIIYAPYQVLGW